MYRFGIIGDDMRMRYLYEALTKDGYCAHLGGIERADAIIADSDIIVLPVNKASLLEKCEGKTVIGGFTSPPPEHKNTVIKNYLSDGSYTIKNALATAEGAIYTAMQSTNDLICRLNIVITGFGNIGKLLTYKLIALGCNVTVTARRKEARAEAESMGANSCDFSGLRFARPDMIFNTVPARVIGSDVLETLSDEARIIELASAPGGVDLDCAARLGVVVISARGLPGKYAPKFAGQILKETVIELAGEV